MQEGTVDHAKHSVGVTAKKLATPPGESAVVNVLLPRECFFTAPATGRANSSVDAVQ